MLSEHIIEGARVRCVYNGSSRYDKIGTIRYVHHSHYGAVLWYRIEWDDGFLGYEQWELPTSFELLEGQTLPERGPSIYERTRHAMKFL